MLEVRERIRCNEPYASLDTLQIPLPAYVHRISERSVRQQFIHQHQTLIQQTKTELTAVYVAAIEARIAQYQTSVQRATDQIYANSSHRQPNGNQEMTRTLIRLIARRISNMQDKFQTKSSFLVESHSRSSARGQLKRTMMINGRETTFKGIGLLPNVIMDTAVLSSSSLSNKLTRKQLALLRRGPTYVAPCQLHLSSSTSSLSSMDEPPPLKKQYRPLMHKMAALFSEYSVSLPIAEEMRRNVKQAFQDCFVKPLSVEARQRAFYEKKLIQSIQRTLNANNLLLRRTSDYSNTFYLAQRDEFQRQSIHYMQQQAGNYALLFTLDADHPHDMVRQSMKKRFQLMNDELERLYQTKRFNTSVRQRLKVNLDNFKIPYLYFLPDVSTVSAMISSAWLTLKIIFSPTTL